MRLTKVSRLGFVIAAVTLLFAGAASAVLAPSHSRRQLHRNELAAHADALALLRGVGLPTDARRSATEPSGDHRLLRFQERLIMEPQARLAHAWWTFTESPSAVLAYVRAHPPKGTRFDQTGTADRGGYTATSYGFDASPVPGKLGAREVMVTATTLTDGQTGVLIEAQSDYIVPRPSSEKVPPGAHELDVTIASVGTERRVHKYTFTAVGRINRAIGLIDSLRILQPGTYSCPSVMVSPHLKRATVNLRAASGTRPLATVEFALQKFTGTACGDPITFTALGHAGHPLLGIKFRHRLASILGIRL